jgi:chromosome segregation ATPase
MRLREVRMNDPKRSENAMVLLQVYEAERELETLRGECNRCIDVLNEVRDWLRSAHREYSAFADSAHLEERFSRLHANVTKREAEFRGFLNLDQMLQIVDNLQNTRAKLKDLREQRSKLGIPQLG